MSLPLKTVALVALLSAAAGFAAGWAWRRHTHPTSAEKFDEASRSFRKGLFGE
jgi:hypothetical protein